MEEVLVCRIKWMVYFEATAPLCQSTTNINVANELGGFYSPYTKHANALVAPATDTKTLATAKTSHGGTDIGTSKTKDSFTTYALTNHASPTIAFTKHPRSAITHTQLTD